MPGANWTHCLWVRNKQDFFDRRAERSSVSTQDISRRLVYSSNYDLPFGKGRRMLTGMNPVAEALLGGWQINGMLTLSTGIPVLVTQNVNNTGLGSSGQRPNNNGASAGRTGLTRDRQIAGWFDTPVFSFAQAFRFGNVARTMPDVRNPGLPTIDFSLFKNLRVKENVIFQIRAEAFNMTNTVQLGAPNAQFGSGQTGVTGGTAVGPRQVFKRGRPRDFANEFKRKRICAGSLRKMPPPEILPQHVIRN